MLQMPELMRQHAGDLVGVLRLVDQTAEQQHLAARQRQRIRNGRRQHRRSDGRIEARGLAQRADQLVECLLAVGGMDRTCRRKWS